MTINDYLKKLDYIAKREFMSATQLVRRIDICHNTFLRIKQNAESCSLQTLRKIKVFVDNWECDNGNVSLPD